MLTTPFVLALHYKSVFFWKNVLKIKIMLIRKLVIVFGILIKRVKLSTDDNDINVNNNRIVTPRKSRTLGHIAGKV